MQVIDFYNNPNIGLFFYTNNEKTIIPEITPTSVKSLIKEELSTELVECNTYESSVNNVFLTGNNEFLFAPSILTNKEEEALNNIKGLKLVVLDTKLNALGNNMCFSKNNVLINPKFENKIVKKLEGLGFKVSKGRVAGVNTVGANLITFGSKALVNPDASESEMESVKKALSLDCVKGTVNNKSNIVKAGLIVNNKGVLVSKNMTGPEMMKVEEVFKNGFKKEEK